MEAYCPLPNLVMPGEATWNTMSDDDRALWLINQERAVRGIPPLEGVEANVAGVAQAYADWLVANNVWGHTADGHDPTWRMTQNAAIGACNDSAWIENLALFAGSGARGVVIAQSIYMWMYRDGPEPGWCDTCNWGHRNAILNSNFNDNACLTGQEGFLGIGHAGAAGYDPQGWMYPYGETVVMNVFDPCDQWAPCDPAAVGLSCFKAAPVQGVGMLVGLVCLGLVATTGLVVGKRRRKE
jgi:hypothetical protein